MPKKESSDEQSYSTIGIVFLIVGLTLIIPEGTRVSGLPFLILGFTFYILGQDTSSKRDKE